MSVSCWKCGSELTQSTSPCSWCNAEKAKAESLGPVTMPTTREAYQTALETVREATRRFRLAQESYRARFIGDAEFLAARAAYNAASVAFDRAHEARAAEVEEIDP